MLVLNIANEQKLNYNKKNMAVRLKTMRNPASVWRQWQWLVAITSVLIDEEGIPRPRVPTH